MRARIHGKRQPNVRLPYERPTSISIYARKLHYGHVCKGFPFLRIPDRSRKPRKIGRTIISDYGLSLGETHQLLEVAGDIIDYAKFTDHAGIVARYSEEWIREKIKVYTEKGVKTFLGGVTFEIAFCQKKIEKYYDRVEELGFNCVEISEDMIEPIKLDVKRELFSQALNHSFEVMMEVGRKLPERAMSKAELIDGIRSCLDMGIEMVTIERSEIELIKEKNPDALREIVEELGLQRLVFEAGPNRWPTLPSWLVTHIDPNVNLENIDANENVIALEGMRRGLHRNVDYSFFSSCKKDFDK